MAAISKAWVVIADAAVDPDSPLDATLITGLRDNDIHVREWLGANFFAGAVQDHDHDGVNSKLIAIGPNYIRNPGFESDLGGWTITAYAGGTVARVTSAGNFSEGIASIGFTSTSTANGGGDALLAEFKPVKGGGTYPVHVDVKGSVANVSSKAEVIWYDSAQAQISATTIYTSTNTETAFTQKSLMATAPSTARFAKIKITGGVPGSGAAFGTIYFDNLFFGEKAYGHVSAGAIVFARSAGLDSTTSTSLVKLKEFAAPLSGTISTTFKLQSRNGAGDTASARIYVNGVAAGTLRTTGASSFQTYNEDLAVVHGDLVQLYASTSNAVNPADVIEFVLSCNLALHPALAVGAP